MLKKELVCVVCPNGCQLDILMEESPLKIHQIEGCTCEKGEEWAKQEIINPMRTIASSIVVKQGNFPMVSVRTNGPIPLESIFDVMVAIKKTTVTAPVKIGDALIVNPGGVDCSIVATRNVHPI